VKVYLPQAVGSPDVPATETGIAGAEYGDESILIVEDDALVRDLALEILKSRGYNVLVAHRPDAAIQLSQQHPGKIDLILTDLVMPGMNGSEMVDEIAVTRPEIGVLFMSGYTDTSIVRDGGLGPGASFLQKPFSPTTLARKVREMLDQLDSAARR